MVEELGTQLRLRLGCLSHHQQSAGVLVDAVYQSHRRVVRVVGRQPSQVPCDGVHQRAVEVAHARVHHHARRLVDHHQRVILIDDVQRYLLGLYRRVIVRTVHHQRHHVARTHLVIALHGLSVYLDEPGIRSFLDAVARLVRQVFRHILVDTHRHLPGVHLHAHVLIELNIVQFFLSHSLFTIH